MSSYELYPDVELVAGHYYEAKRQGSKKPLPAWGKLPEAEKEKIRAMIRMMYVAIGKARQ